MSNFKSYSLAILQKHAESQGINVQKKGKTVKFVNKTREELFNELKAVKFSFEKHPKKKVTPKPKKTTKKKAPAASAKASVKKKAPVKKKVPVKKKAPSTSAKKKKKALTKKVKPTYSEKTIARALDRYIHGYLLVDFNKEVDQIMLIYFRDKIKKFFTLKGEPNYDRFVEELVYLPGIIDKNSSRIKKEFEEIKKEMIPELKKLREMYL